MDPYEVEGEKGAEHESLITPPSSDNRPSLQQDERVNYQPYRPPPYQAHWCKRLPCIFLLSVAATVIGSSTQFGYATGVLNSPQHVIRESFSDRNITFSSLEMNVAVSIFAIGGLLGAVPAGIMADFLGRKHTLLVNNLLVWIGIGLQSLAVHPAMFIAGRFIVGVNSGINTVLVPVYISEISPVRLRGAVGVLHQMAITTSLLLAQILGIRKVLGRPDSNSFFSWRVLFAVPLLFSVVQLALLPWSPRSPRFLLIKKKNEPAAKRALKRLRGMGANIDEEIQEMQDELDNQQQRIKFVEFLTVKYLRRALFVSIALHLAQQLSGINGIFYYSTAVFQLAGVSDADIATVAVGLVLVTVTFITVFIIELVGRRTLMLYGLGGMTVSFLLLTCMFCFQDGFYHNNSTNYATAPGVLLVIFSLTTVALFALGPGSIPWLMVSELFLQEARPIAVGIATVVNWFANFTVGLTFPYILKYLYPYGTSVFVVTCGVLWIYLYRYLPETKGLSVEQVTVRLRRSIRT